MCRLNPAWVFVAAALAAAGCGNGGSASQAEKDAAKRARDQELLALDYPKAGGSLPRSIEVSYDGARDRTTMTLKLEGLRVSGTSQVSSATLYLTSSHKGRERAVDNPEGSADGSFVVVTATPGILAYSGAPGAATIGERAVPFKEASGKEHYVSAKAAGGREEVRFRFPTEGLVAAAKEESFSMSFGTVRVDVSGQPHADFREFVARMNPKR